MDSLNWRLVVNFLAWPTATFFNRIRISVIKIGHKWKSINQVMFIWDRKKQHHVCQQVSYKVIIITIIIIV